MKNMPNSFDDTELWESGKLGASEDHVRPVSREKSKQIDEALGLETITVRVEKELAEQLKVLAEKEGVIYQAFIRQILTSYVRECTGGSTSTENRIDT